MKVMKINEVTKIQIVMSVKEALRLRDSLSNINLTGELDILLDRLTPHLEGFRLSVDGIVETIDNELG